jgi:hypothetical protein
MTAQVLTANRLSDGEVVFFGSGHWVGHISEADIFIGDAGAPALAAAEAQPTVVVAPYLIDVTPTAGVPVPVSYRERVRALGPTIHPDMGKQAENVHEAEVIEHAQGAARSTGRVALIKRK